MTDDERIKSILSEIDYGYIGYDNVHGDNGQGMMLIKDALERATPKRPGIEYDGYADGNPVYDYFCPNCNHEFDDIESELCCPDCGQRILWSKCYDE